MTTPLLEIKDLTVDFRGRDESLKKIVRGVSLTLNPGERMGLVGESGCGKSTLQLAAMGLLPPNAEVSGSVLIDGVDILAGGEASMRAHRGTDLAMVFQGAMNAFNPTRTVGSQIVEAMVVHGGTSKRAAQDRTRDLLGLVGIPPDRAERYPHQFSGGMRQRVALAMALANHPRVLLADEPTTALDVIMQAQILELLEKLTKELGLALLLVTHDLPIVVETCDWAAVMYAGRIVERGPIDEIHQQPTHPYTRLLFATVPGPDVDQRVASLPGVPPDASEEPPGCSFAPRCDRTIDICHNTRPQPGPIGPRHIAECHVAVPTRTRPAVREGDSDD